MSEQHSHLDDYQLALKCLAGDTESVCRFQKKHGPPLLAFLRRSGASEAEGVEMVNETMTDCLSATSAAGPKLAKFNGASSLQTWLNRVGLNKFITFKRRQTLENRFMERMDDHNPDSDDSGGAPAGNLEDVEPERDVLLGIMRSAIDSAFRKCPAEDFVMLRLAHCDRLKVTELAVMFDCNAGTISRRLEVAGERINLATRLHIKETDPYLDLKWDDFVELCKSASSGSFEED